MCVCARTGRCGVHRCQSSGGTRRSLSVADKRFSRESQQSNKTCDTILKNRGRMHPCHNLQIQHEAKQPTWRTKMRGRRACTNETSKTNPYQVLSFGWSRPPCTFVMRAETTGNWHRGRKLSAEGYLNSREKSAGYLRAIQEFSSASENAMRTSAAHVSSANEPKRTTPTPATTPTVSPTMSAMHAGMRWSFSAKWYSYVTERAAPTAAVSVDIPTLTRQKGPIMNITTRIQR